MTNSPKLRVGITGGIAAGGPQRDQSLEKIRLADQMGFDSVWFGETWGYDMVTAMGEVVRATEDVGARFPEEARKIHYEEVPHRAIRGVASADEAKELADEGIEFSPIPPILTREDH